MWTKMMLWTAVVALLPRPTPVTASGVFELRLKSFVNEYGKDSLGKCCSGTTSRTGECSGVCRTRFRVCLKQYQAKIDTTTPCTYGDVVTPVLGENVVNLSSTVALPSFSNPISFPFDFTWPGTFSLIVEAYHDANDTTHHSPEKVLITRLTTQRWLDVGPTWVEDEHRSAHSLMVYEYRVTCVAHYYGKGCENLCRPRDDGFGHYSCSPTGERVCLSGWKDDYCATPRCLPGCDEQHGHCSRPNECLCHNGWTGAFCDQCVRYPGCLHGSCQKPWECLCDEGWGGLFCNQDLNYCTNHKPCLNGGTCFNTGQGSYTCSCAPGFTGAECQTPLVDCHSRPCLNGGACAPESRRHANATAVAAAGYRCTCPPGWRGRHCEVSTRSCRDSPCRRGATCEDDALKGYACRCPPGYSGPDCETRVDDCAPNPCANGGTCSTRPDGFRCTCPAGFTGERCDVDVDDCRSDPCLNGATCVDLVDRFRCQCVPGFVGALCQDKVDYCLAKPCANGGRCTSGTNDYECECRPGFTGKDCSVDVDECRSAPCRNGGTCRNRVNGFTCECPRSWRGEICAEEARGPVAAAAPPSGASYWSGNLSRHVASEAGAAGLTTEHVVVIATLSTAVPAFVLVAAVAVMCMKRRQKREQAKADEEARLQNERNAVHSSLGKRGALGALGGLGGLGGLAALGGSAAAPGGPGGAGPAGPGDPHMIKNTWAANKSVNNAPARDDLDCSFSSGDALDAGGGGGGYKPEPVVQDGRPRATKQLNTDAAAHRASHLYQKEKDCGLGVGVGIGIGISVGVGVLDAKRSSVFAGGDSCCGEAALLKRPAIAEGPGSGPGAESGCGVYVIDDHYRHDASLAATLATEV
ncbi:neurogenic locus protein delta [Orussus abietinus]|uniref:neurogenic locus protein delta n=1 Tax=Orussus abietinus TaxID=222816 RepID=UPI000625D144|nr:neurogenic locus protein delta [Orussus abietinus]